MVVNLRKNGYEREYRSYALTILFKPFREEETIGGGQMSITFVFGKNINSLEIESEI